MSESRIISSPNLYGTIPVYGTYYYRIVIEGATAYID